MAEVCFSTLKCTPSCAPHKPCPAGSAHAGLRQQQKRQSCAPSAPRWWLELAQSQHSTAAGTTRFCLLCFQPRPIPGFLTARAPRLPPRRLCRVRSIKWIETLHKLQLPRSSGTLHCQARISDWRPAEISSPAPWESAPGDFSFRLAVDYALLVAGTQV